MGLKEFEIKIVRRIPEELENGSLYVCFECNVVVHKCACGCGEKVVLPIAPDFWSVKYDGECISMHPSIGNFQFPCRSHYWIRENKVIWAEENVQDIKGSKGKKKKKNLWGIIKDIFL